LLDLGQVSFLGNDASADQMVFTPDFLGSEMAGDGAARYYGYSTQREDLATLFATSMMKLDFGIDVYVAFVSKPTDLQNYTCDELVVGWGQRNRIADPNVRPRAKWVLEKIYGQSAELDTFFASNIGNLELMQPGLSWCTNRDARIFSDFTTQTPTRKGAGEGSSQLSFEQLELERRVRLH